MNAMATVETIRGSVQAVLFSNDEGFHVLNVALASEADSAAQGVSVVGVGLNIQIGEHLVATGEWTNHPRFGRQFKADSIVNEPPGDLEGLRAYLKSGVIRGVGPAIADKIIDALGSHAREGLGNEQALMGVPGLGRKRAEGIAAAWRESVDSREATIYLQRHGLGPGRARAVWRLFGTDTVSAVQRNPYRTLLQVRGVGFLIADAVAQSVGFEKTHPDRIFAGIRHVIDARAQDGHIVTEPRALVQAACKLLGVDPELVAGRIEGLAQRGFLERMDDGRLGLPYLVDAEARIAQRLLGMAAAKTDMPELGENPTTADGKPLTAEQIAAVREVLATRIGVLAGGPGVGKTTVSCAIADALVAAGLRLGLCAPTGRAARRMAQATGWSAMTIHRLLGAGPEGFERNKDNPLEVDALLVDEVSMVDVQLMAALLAALPETARLILVGDPDQLISVGAGNVLGDVIASGAIPVARLQFNHRQDGDSAIIVQSHRINAGKTPEHGGDFVIIPSQEGHEALAQEVVEAVRALAAEGFDPLQDVQVLTPMHKGAAGTATLNEKLREAFGESARYKLRGREWTYGDKVVQIANDYTLDVMNGDLGFVHSIDTEEGQMSVRLDDRLVVYEAARVANLHLAYAMTGHKAQGSEFPAVVIPVTTQHWHMLERQWLYTAVTRGKQRVVLVAEDRALRQAVRHLSGHRRMTTLRERLERGSQLQHEEESKPAGGTLLSQ